MKALAVLAACLLIVNPVHAEVSIITDGRSLAGTCQTALVTLEQTTNTSTENVQGDAFVCMAFLGGLMGATQHANELARLRFAVATGGHATEKPFTLYCFDWQLPYGRVAQLVLDYAKHNPGLLQRPAQELALRALQSAFPCR
jgi:hypothetical protein